MTMTLAAPVRGSAPPPVPWRPLLWVAWRRYRSALVTTLAILGVLAVYLLVRGEQIRHAYAAVLACAPQGGLKCHFAFDNFQNHYGSFGFLAALLLWLPGLIGAFAGAPLLARELETGTFRYAWTQGVGRMRWLLALVVPGLLGVAAATALLGVMLTWYERPLLQSGLEQRLHQSVFPLTGVAVVGWGVAAYSLGVFAGLVLRRVVPALAVTLVVWTGLQFAASQLRGHYLAPLRTSSLQLSNHALSVQQWWTAGGVRVGDDRINQALQAIGVRSTGNGQGFAAQVGSGPQDPIQYLVQHGFTQWTSYQPDSRYWPFQGIELAWLAVLSAVLLGLAVWRVRRRTG
jgi:hypothetical protein